MISSILNDYNEGEVLLAAQKLRMRLHGQEDAATPAQGGALTSGRTVEPLVSPLPPTAVAVLPYKGRAAPFLMLRLA